MGTRRDRIVVCARRPHNPCLRAVARYGDRVKQVVAGKEQYAYREDPLAWQPDQRRKNDHADTGGPDDLYIKEWVMRCRDPGKEYEDRRAVVGDKSGEEEDGSGLCQIQRIKMPCVPVEIITDMIECHDDHDDPSEEVNEGDPSASHKKNWFGVFRKKKPAQ